MRVLTIAKFLLHVILEEQLLRKTCLCTHICRNSHIILCSMSIGLGRKFKTSLTGSISVSLDLRENGLIISRIADNGHRLPVLGSAAQH